MKEKAQEKIDLANELALDQVDKEIAEEEKEKMKMLTNDGGSTKPPSTSSSSSESKSDGFDSLYTYEDVLFFHGGYKEGGETKRFIPHGDDGRNYVPYICPDYCSSPYDEFFLRRRKVYLMLRNHKDHPPTPSPLLGGTYSGHLQDPKFIKTYNQVVIGKLVMVRFAFLSVCKNIRALPGEDKGKLVGSTERYARERISKMIVGLSQLRTIPVCALDRRVVCDYVSGVETQPNADFLLSVAQARTIEVIGHAWKNWERFTFTVWYDSDWHDKEDRFCNYKEGERQKYT